MRSNTIQTLLTRSALAALVLLAGASAAAQQQVNLTANPATATLPDGTAVPMWGYSCDAAQPTGTTATCAPLGLAGPGAWSPVVITVPTGQDLQINLTNNLSFATGSGTNNVPTSITVVGQVGGGLGVPTAAASPTHVVQGTTWPIAGDTSGATFNPPAQGPRVQSFGAEVPGGGQASLCWGPSCGSPSPPLRPGTYLLESGTHPSIQGPMGLYGILVVTAAPASGAAGTAYPGVSYGAEVPLLFSEIDPIQNAAVQAAVGTAGFRETSARVLRDKVSSVTLALDPSGNVINAGTGYSAGATVAFAPPTACSVPPSAVVGSVDGAGAIQTVTVTNPGSGCTEIPTATAAGGTGAQLSVNLSLQQSMCSDGAAACYPPAVNYTPLYFLVNGAAFDKLNPARSLFPAVAGVDATSSPVTTGITGNVLVRMVNAGLRMHVPAIVGSQTGTAAVPGLSLIAEDGNVLPGVPRVQSEVFLAAGKTYDVMVNVPAAPAALPTFDRELSLSGNAANRDSGMLAYIGINGGAAPTAAATAGATANPDTYNALIAGQPLTVSAPTLGVMANDVNVHVVRLVTQAASGVVTLNGNGTFRYVPNAGSTATSDSFGYCANGAAAGTGGLCTTVTLGASNIADSGVVCAASTFSSNVASQLTVKPPGVLAGCSDGAALPMTVAGATAAAPLTVALTGPGTGSAVLDPNGGLTASVTVPGTYTFTFQAQTGLAATSNAATVSLVFPTPTGLSVAVLDGSSKDPTNPITDYRWIIEEDRTFYVDPTNTVNNGTGNIFNFSTNFHTSYMPLVATGCTGPKSCEAGQTLLGSPAVCDVGNGACRTDATQEAPLDPGQVHLDPAKRYYLSVLPGDAADPFNAGYAGAPDCSPAGVAAGSCGHGMGGAPINKGQTSVMVLTQPSPYPTAKLTVFVFEDDYPLNGEHDAGGGVDVLSPNEPGLGGFQVTLFDDAGGTGDATGQPTYDMFNMPLTNSLAGTIDPVSGMDACPISSQVTASTTTGDGSQKGIVGMIVTCPTFESDGKTLSPLAGQAIVNNLYQGRYGVVANPGADRIARGEEWLQTNTLDGQKAHDSFMRIGEPAYFQEFGPAGYHVTIGFANPKIINDRKAGICASAACGNELKGHVTTARMSRPPDERLYGSGSRDSYSFTQCYVSLGDPDGADFQFVKCDGDGNFDFTGVPAGNWKVTIFDQWNDQIVDGISTPVGLGCAGTTSGLCPPGTVTAPVTVDMGEVAVHQWQSNIYTRSFIDTNGNGIPDRDAQGNDLELGLALASTNIRFRDGSFSNFNNTDLNGYAGFNEVFPLFNWYVIETDSTNYKSTGTHVVYDAGGPTDGTCGASNAQCGGSSIGHFMANTSELVSLPTNLRVPGAVYCAGADCNGKTIAAGPASSDPPTAGCTTDSSGNVTCQTALSTGRIDPPFWFGSYGWQGFAGQNSFLEFGKKPFAEHENGGIHGHVVYASTRPFDDPQLLLQLSWEPLVPHVRVNLYREGVASDGITPTLTLVDHTETSSFDDWAQGFRADGVPNMNCPGQGSDDPFFFGLSGQKQYLDVYANGAAARALPNSSQFKCYDGMHNWNQLQPAPYDGIYGFPSVTSLDPQSGRPAGTNCTDCTTNPDSSDPYRAGTPMLRPGKYVVEVVVPSGYELVKEEDKNILIGDNYIAPVTQQFAGLGNIFILPDQATVAASANPYNPQNPTTDLGAAPRHEGDTGSVETFWPCVGAERVVPDYISLFPGSAEVAPFAGATRHLCDRKEVTLTDQMSALAKFYVYTSTHVASHFTGVITDDFTGEFDPFSPQFGEKFAPAYLPVSLKDWAGNEISRVYSDQWGSYNGLSYSTWEVNPPNPTGYGPTMMVVCMNDSGSGTSAPWWDPTAVKSAQPDPLFQGGYSQFCYELPFMPGQTGYFDTPVTPTSAFSEGYNHPDCNYPDATPAIKQVNGDGVGPWVSAPGHTLTITALGDQSVDNYGYSGPSSTAAPFNQLKITRHYGFGTTRGSVSIGGVQLNPAQITSWTDATITVTVPANVPSCAVQQQAQYGGSTARCGELVITNANGKQSVDTVTVTVGGKAPAVLAAGHTIQSAIDAASPGDLIIVPPGVYNEMLLMWKPVRLQGVGAASAIIDANTQPAGKLDPWRTQVACLFGLTPTGRPRDLSDNTCAQSWAFASGGPDFPTMIIDRLPFEALLGWDTTLNGNLAEQLIEPSLMGAYEGAAITVLGKGVVIPTGTGLLDAFGNTVGSAFPANTRLLLAGDCGPSNGHNPYPSNFYCNPSSIDGLGVRDSSQGGGGIFVHAYAHNLQIANNRVYGNTGTQNGGIAIGQGEHADVALAGQTPTAFPGSCETSRTANLSLPFCYDMHVNVHHNSVTQNASMGDELFSSTGAGGGGINLYTGADYYTLTNNWVCGNIGVGDGGGVAHIGFIKNGDIEHNSILFNQSTNPTITTNGGGILVMGAPDVDPPCSTQDQDCVPTPPGSVTPSDGTGPGLVINANLILGNSAESGSGGGLRLQHVNGTDVLNFPNGAAACSQSLSSCNWNSVTVTNNVIADNVAGWDGGGVSLQDALAVNIVNNTIISNDSTASSGVLFDSLFAPLASAPAANCRDPGNPSASCAQVAGLVSVTNSPILTANLQALPGPGLRCPAGHGTGTGATATCGQLSVPLLYNNVIWQNRSFYIDVTPPTGVGLTGRQSTVALFDAFTPTLAPNQTATGQCPSPASYWDIGVRGDQGPANHASGFQLFPTYSVLTDAVDYPGANNTASNPAVVSQYCNGSRVPPEDVCKDGNGNVIPCGWQVPPGTNETNALPLPIFTLAASATVDEGNNWINMRWGPLSLTNPVSGATLANYAPGPGSPAINYVPATATTAYGLAPSTDFFGTSRKNGAVDAGAIEFAGGAAAIASITGGPLAFGNTPVGTASATQNLTLHNLGNAQLTGIALAFTGPFTRVTTGAFPPLAPSCGTTLNAGANCTIKVAFQPTAAGAASGSLAVTGSVPVSGSPVALTGTGVTPVISATLAPATWSPTGTRGCNLLTCPAQVFTLTNTGNVNLTGIGQGALGGTSPTSYSILRVASTCGPAGGGQLLGQTTLVPGASCIVTVRFTPSTGTTTGLKPATLTVSDMAGTQTSALNGTAR